MTLSTPIYFQNDQWAVTSFGLERVNGWPYFLEGAALAETREWCGKIIIPAMALHLAEKEWVDLDLMMPALAVGVACFVRHHHFGAHWYRHTLLAVHGVRVDWRGSLHPLAQRSMQEHDRLSEEPILNG